ncbi:MAG: hypothetical protein AAFP90_24020 [Planctomycetota bacterium]
MTDRFALQSHERLIG